MKSLKNKWLLLTAIFGVLLVSGVALAAPDDEEDTVLNFGYDSESQVFVWNTSLVEGDLDCSMDNGPLTATYQVNDEGLVMVEGLTHEGSMDPVTFEARDGVSDPAEYTSDGECALGGGSVAGPNGQINHGMFMKLFNSIFEGKGRGCVVRHFAQSDLGKGDQQVKAGENETEAVVTGDTGTIDFETILTDCEKPNGNGNGNGNGDSSTRGGKPDSPGKSGDAPGHNKP